mgnify:CR=1 FL=1
MITATIITLLLILNITTIILIKRLLIRIKAYEDWVTDLQSELISTIEKMREIDKQGVFATSMNSQGMFECDDQVGVIFKELLSVVEKINDKIE